MLIVKAIRAIWLGTSWLKVTKWSLISIFKIRFQSRTNCDLSRRHLTSQKGLKLLQLSTILLIGPISFELSLRRLIPGVRSSLTWRAPPQLYWKWRFQIAHRRQEIDRFRSRLAGLTATCLNEAPHHDVPATKYDDCPATILTEDNLEISVVSGDQLRSGNYIY